MAVGQPMIALARTVLADDCICRGAVRDESRRVTAERGSWLQGREGGMCTASEEAEENGSRW